MPLTLELTYDFDHKDILEIPVEIWRKNTQKTHKLLITQKPIQSIMLDPYFQSADANLDNNVWPRKLISKTFQLKKKKKEKNPMQKANTEKKETPKKNKNNP